MADYLVEGKDAYLCTVERMVKSSAPLSNRAMKAVGLMSDRPRFATEEECTEAFANAGDYLRGLR